MKKIILTLASVLFTGSFAFAQYGNKPVVSNDLSYDIRGTYSHPIKKVKLNEAKVLSDLISGYPANWISNYVSVEILATCAGKSMKSISANDVLTNEQKNILKTVDLGTDIIINSKYKIKNPVTNLIEDSKMTFSAMAVPDVEAEYVGGKEQLIKTIKENVTKRISESTLKKLQPVVIRFTVNEGGEIGSAIVTKTSGDLKIDKVLLEVINKMQNWKPAQNTNGIKVKQEFIFGVGNMGC